MEVLRQRTGEEQRATFLELFFDLVFVFAVTQLSHHLLTHLTVEGVAQTLFLLLVVWWAWIYTTWMTNWFDPDAVPVRVVLLGGMLASLLMATAIPDAFGDRALLFAGGYVALQAGRNAFIVVATEPVERLHVAFRRILAWSSWVGAIWIAGALLEGEARTAVWLAALLLDYAGPYAGYWTPGLGRTEATDWELEHAHFAERFQLFIIIVLGESIVLTGATASELDLTTAGWLAIAAAFVLTATLWWLYFDEVARRSLEDFGDAADERGRLGRDAYTYLHIPIVAGILVSAVGVELVIAHPDESLPAAELVALAAGPVLYLLGHLGFRMRMIHSLAPKRLAAIGAIAAIALATSAAPSLVTLTLVVAVLVVLAASETLGRLRAVPPAGTG
jgi:low temperature requirement protein LtrA